MAAKKAQQLYSFQKPSRWSSGYGLELPDAYRKFWKEWKHQKPAAVHYIEKEGKFERSDRGVVIPVQNVALPLRYPKEEHDGIWGGEAVVQGFVKKGYYKRRIPKFWVPKLHRSVVYSQVLNSYMRVTLTNRTLMLIHENYGFDHYLLKTPACDLRSALALHIKKNILTALADKTLYPDDPVKREEIYDTYKQYLQSYTREEIEWYGLTWKEACLKWMRIKAAKNKKEPLKLQYRSELIARLKKGNIEEAMNVTMPEAEKSWISKMNPFGNRSKL